MNAVLESERLESDVLRQLSRLCTDPDGEDVVSSGQVCTVVATGSTVRILLDEARIPDGAAEPLSEALAPLAYAVPGVERVIIKPRPKSIARHTSLPGIQRVIAVHSGKGGVGKSTLAVSLALSWQAQGLRVGLLDADIYGPTVPTLLGASARIDQRMTDGLMEPILCRGMPVMSLGFLMPPEQALAWRGGMAAEGVPQLFSDVAWGALDLLVVDLPPGTSDVHLAVAGHIRLDGVIAVSAPMDLSTLDLRRGLEMFADLAVPCLGIIENLAGLHCRGCGHLMHPFGNHPLRELAEELGVELLGSIPVDPAFGATAGDAEGGSVGPNGPAQAAVDALARRLHHRWYGGPATLEERA